MSPQIRKILFAMDLSKNSAYAFGYALELARNRKADIVLLHAIEPIPAIARFHGTREGEMKYYNKTTEEWIQGIGAAVRTYCDRTTEKLGEPCAQTIQKILCAVGHPTEEILRAAEEEDCDLILMGSHAKGFLRHTFLGSVSRAVLDRSYKPVLIVPLPSDEAGAGWDRG